jgi:hypothetical protein
MLPLPFEAPPQNVCPVDRRVMFVNLFLKQFIILKKKNMEKKKTSRCKAQDRSKVACGQDNK